MKKRILSLLLALVLLVGLLPTVSLAAGGSGSVDVYIIGRDELITYQQIDLDEAKQIDVSSYSSSTAEGTTALHAIVAALQEEDMLNTFDCTGGYITEIAGLVAGRPNYMSGWMCKVNNVFPNVGAAQSSLKDGDEIVLFWEQGLDGQQYCQFKEGRKAEVETGKPLTLTPEVTPLDLEDGLGKDLEFNTLTTAKYSMFLYVDGKQYPDRLLSTKPSADLYFSTPGTHVVTAKVVHQASVGPVQDVLTTPVCVVTVTGDALPETGSLKTLKITDSSKNVLSELEIKDGVTDYDLDVDYAHKTIKFEAEFDQTAKDNNARITSLFTRSALTNALGGAIAISEAKPGVTVGTFMNALAVGENELSIYVLSDLKTHAYRPIYLHVNRSANSPDAKLNSLTVELGSDELCTSAANDQLSHPGRTILKLFYQKADGSIASCTGTKPEASVREYTVYAPHETEQVQISPVVVADGTYTIYDASGNVCGSTLVDFKEDSAVYTIETVSSDGTGEETYTLTLVRRPNIALTGASIDCGRLWLPGVIPGYNKLMLFVTDTEAEEYTAAFTAAPGTKLYYESISEENLLSDGKLTRPTPKMSNSSTSEFNLIVAGELEDGSVYSRVIKVSIEEMRTEGEMVELVVSPSQHMLNHPYDTPSGGAMLSAFGGYMTTYFKNPIKNDPNNLYGLDFYVSGNPNYPNVWSFGEPAQIYVAQDKDGDGEPDKWYALAGSEHYEDSTYWDYEITYTNEGNQKVRWDDNYGNTGYVCGLNGGCSFPSAKVQTVNSRYRTQYQPGVLTLGGILIGPIKSQNMIYAPITIFGYGDCYPASQTLGQGASNPYRDPGLSSIDSSLSEEDQEKAMTDLYGKTSHGDAMDISWAVDENGNPVYLDEISFVRAMSAINVDSGIFNEKSPEISGARRLPSSDRREQPVGISNLPDTITINGKAVDLSRIHPVNGQATATVYLAEGEQSAAITVDAGDRNVILGNRYRKTFTYDTVAETGRLVRIITQDGEKAPNILVLNIQRYDADHAAAEPAETLIDAIGEVTAASGDAIRAARKAYDALTDEQKALVSNYQALLDAEARYRALTAPVVPVTPSKPSQKPDTGSTLPFTDVFANSWFYDGVKYACEKGFMNGTGSTTFSPDADTTRGMIVTMLARLEGVNTAGTLWYAAGQKWAMDTGISDGTNMTGAVTREQLAAILYRYAKQKGYDVTKSAALTSFTDADTASSYAVEAMQWAVASGLIQGSGSRLSPKATASRAQVATILMRFMELYAK